MRARLSLVIISALALIPVANAQTAAATKAAAADRADAEPAVTQDAFAQPAAGQPAAIQPAATQPAATQAAATQAAATQPAAAPPSEPAAPQAARRALSRQWPSQRATAAAHASAAGQSGGVLSLGASDITGNKELPKVMVIVPWKDSLGAGGVVKPTDSLLDEVLQPVDRGVFQRRIRYYGQLDGRAEHPADADSANGVRKPVAPVGDSH